MSFDEAVLSAGIFFDTSVLVDFVLPGGDRGSGDLISDEQLKVVISNKVESEFGEVPDRKSTLYDDVLNYLLSGGEIAEYEGSNLNHNDRGTLEDIRDTFEDSDRVTILNRLRERQREITRRQDFINDRIDEVVPRSNNLELLFSLSPIIDNEDDCQVVADASGWSKNGGSGYLTTLDYNDIISQEVDINEAIAEHQSGGELVIRPPTGD